MQVQTFRVLEVDDDDNSAQLQCCQLNDAVKRVGGLPVASPEHLVVATTFSKAMLTAAWCRPDQPVKEGDIVHGCFEFDPKESLARGRMPVFNVAR